MNLLNKFNKLRAQELKNGILDVDLKHVAGINNFEPGYLSKKDEVIVGLQTDKPLKRIINPFGGMRMVKTSLEAFGYKLPNNILEEFKKLGIIKKETDKKWLSYMRMIWCLQK